MFLIPLVQSFIVRFLRCKFLHDVSYQAIFIVRYIHYIKVLTQKFFCRTHLGGRDNLTLRNTGLSNLILFPEHVRKSRIVRLYCFSTVFDGNLLLVNQHRSNYSNINFPPAIRNSLITTLDISHGSGQFLHILHFQIFFHLDGSSTIFFLASHHAIQIVAIQYSQNVSIRICIFCNESKLTVNMSH